MVKPPTYLYTAILLPAKLDFSELAFADGVSKDVIAESDNLVAFP